MTIMLMLMAQHSALFVCYSNVMHPLVVTGRKYEGPQKSKKYKSRYLIFLDKLTFIFGVVGPFTILPQIYTIYTTKSATGVSMMTWLMVFLMTIPWILYGLAHKSRLIFACFILWALMDLLVVIGVFIYG